MQTFLKTSQEPESFKDVDLSRIDKTLLDSLMPFQREGIWYVFSVTEYHLFANSLTVVNNALYTHYCSDMFLWCSSPSNALLNPNTTTLELKYGCHPEVLGDVKSFVPR
jgi:hypothetical protein